MSVPRKISFWTLPQNETPFQVEHFQLVSFLNPFPKFRFSQLAARTEWNRTLGDHSSCDNCQISLKTALFLAHIYHSHYQVYYDVGLASHLNMMTLHMVLFVEKFNLMDEKELTPLDDLIIPLKKFALRPDSTPTPDSSQDEDD